MRWRVRLFDGPTLESSDGQEVSRFRSHQVGALLSYLALRLGKTCPREELECALWPDETTSSVLANRLRVTLASLRRHLEPAGVPFGSVLDVSVPGRVRLRSEEVWCDVGEFVSALDRGHREDARLLRQGDVLPGFYEDWAILERERIEALAEDLQFAPRERRPETLEIKSDLNLPHPRSATYPIPLYLTKFFGRSAELVSLEDLVAKHRLTTVTGPGGMGKTRLVSEWSRQRPDPILFVGLAEAIDAVDVLQCVIKALRLSLSAQDDLTVQLLSILKGLPLRVMILDNAEQVVEPVAQLVLRLLEDVPHLRVVVTSRQRLNVNGEAILPLQPLPAPSPETAYDELPILPAVALFLDRARSARPDFVLLARHTDAVLKICGHLQGVPLALELAAARVIAQTPSQIETSLSQNLTNLKSRQRGLSPRHQSLRASIQGSFDLLDPPLRVFFAKLSVFASGWSVEAAQAVTGEPESEWFLEELVQRSLLFVAEDELRNSVRYGWLESIRQFAGEQVDATSREELQQAHSIYFLKIASQVTEDNVRTFQSLDADLDNLLRALESGRVSESPHLWTGLRGALAFAHVRGHHRQFLPWAEFALELAVRVSDVRAAMHLRYSAYFIFSYAGLTERIQEIGEVMAAESERHGDKQGEILALLILAWAATQNNELPASLSIAENAVTAANTTGDLFLMAQSHRICGFICSLQAEQWGLPPQDIKGYLEQGEKHLRTCLVQLPPQSSHRPFTEMTLSYVLTMTDRVPEAYDLVKSVQAVAMREGMQSIAIFAFHQESKIAGILQQFDFGAIAFGAYLGMKERTGYNAFSVDPPSEANARFLLSKLGRKRFDELVEQGRRASIPGLVLKRIEF